MLHDKDRWRPRAYIGLGKFLSPVRARNGNRDGRPVCDLPPTQQREEETI